MIITRTPYRLSLFGGGSDYPEWYLNHGGDVLAGAINKYCYLTLRRLPPFFPHRHRLVYSRIESVTNVAEIEHPAIREAFRHYGVSEGLELHHDGDLPARSGIGSSAAFAVGIIHALRVLNGLQTDAWTLAREATHLETDLLGEVGGHQDQITCAIGGFNHIVFRPDGDIIVSSGASLARNVMRFSEWLVLFYSGVQRSSSDVSVGLKTALESDENQEMHELSRIVGEAKVLLEDGSEQAFASLGTLMHETWILKRAVNPRSGTLELDRLYAAARSAGALGGKVSGAGGGGFLLFCVPPSERASFLERMQPLGLHVPFRFVNHGSQILLGETDEGTGRLPERLV